MFATPSSRWTALVNRDQAASNSFIYSVITTKIYCRPNCPSRLARRANIVFHNTAEEAEKDGYRACMRCKPGIDDCDRQKAAVGTACMLLKEEVNSGIRRGSTVDKWSVKALAKAVGLTESHFCRVFKKITGMTIGEYRGQLQSSSYVSPVNAGPVTPAHFTRKPAVSVHDTTQYVVSESDSSLLAFDSSNDWNPLSGGAYTHSRHELLADMDLAEYSATFETIHKPWLEDISDPSTPSTYDGMEFVDFGISCPQGYLE